MPRAAARSSVVKRTAEGPVAAASEAWAFEAAETASLATEA
ncbi:hypothetical protein [Corallococcus exercitus]|nr:hypothetical protein [Corallococcus exercitus]